MGSLSSESGPDPRFGQRYLGLTGLPGGWEWERGTSHGTAFEELGIQGSPRTVGAFPPLLPHPKPCAVPPEAYPLLPVSPFSIFCLSTDPDTSVSHIPLGPTRSRSPAGLLGQGCSLHEKSTWRGPQLEAGTLSDACAVPALRDPVAAICLPHALQGPSHSLSVASCHRPRPLCLHSSLCAALWPMRSQKIL